MLQSGLVDDLQGYTTVDPMKLKELLWPDVYFYKQQRQVIYSVWDNDQTFVPAGNMLGKDFTAGFVAVAAFLTRYPCRIVTTSAKEDHLRVLWGEMGRYIHSARYPLDWRKGGPIISNHQELRRLIDGDRCPLSYVKGMVASDSTEAAMQGHHIAKTGDGIWRTLFIADECSSVPHAYWRLASTWANRMMAIGNTWPCDNFFKHAVKGRPGTKDKGGDLPRKFTEEHRKSWVAVHRPSPDSPPPPESVTTTEEAPLGYVRKVIKIRAVDSPNVRYALAQQAAGIEPTDEMIVEGVKSWSEYQKNLVIWDDMEQAVSLNAEFYEGSTIKLFPDAWLTRAERIAQELRTSRFKRVAKGLGIDPAEGGDKSAWCVVDEYGVLDLISMKTPDTNIVPSTTLALMFKYNLRPDQVVFDRGGGGKEHADRLRGMGHNVRTMSFGETVVPDPRRGKSGHNQKIDQREQRYAYFNRRAEMYGELSEALNPSNEPGFGLPLWMPEFRAQLSPFPKAYDGEGRLKLPPKGKKDGDSKVICLIDLIGHSPDEADALVLAYHAMTHKPLVSSAGIG